MSSKKERAISDAKSLLLSHGLSYEVSPKEFFRWFKVPTASNDLGLDQVLRRPLLVAHEIAEIAEVKRMGLPITKDMIRKNQGRVYEAHLKAFAVELTLAERMNDLMHIRRRLKDIRNWTDDPLLPRRLRPEFQRLYSRAMKALKEGRPAAGNLIIREAKQQDWKSVLHIQQSDSVFPYLGRSHRPSKTHVRGRWMARLAEPGVHTIVAVSGDEVVGYARLKRGEGLGSHAGEVSIVAVRPDFRGMGVGRRLLKEMLGLAKGLGLRRLRLTVHEDNPVAISLYKSMGFEVEGREREAIRRRRTFVDLLIMGRLEPKR